ncbi:MAG TPA: ABC transporter ATP-binding protein [Acidimicrobiales bacterium]|nr:ABC transporter ATP-binding protein [Acidimicrobiales bacterium]
MPSGASAAATPAGQSVRQMRGDRSILRQSVRPGTVKRVATFARPYRRLLALYSAVTILDAVAAAVNPLLFRAIIDTGIEGHRDRFIIVLAVVAAVLAVFDALFTLAERVVTAKVGEGLVCDMRTKVFDHVQRMPLAFFTRTQTGSLVSRLNGDVLGAQTAFTDLMSNVVANVVLVTFVLAVMLVLSWQITLIALVILPIVGLPIRRLGRRLATITRQRYDNVSVMVSMMVERFNVGGALHVKLFGDPESEAATFAARASKVRDLGVDLSLVGRVFFVALTLIAALATSFVYGYGGILAAHGTLELGSVVALAAYLGRLYSPLSSLANANVDVMTTLVAFDRVFEILDLTPTVAESDDAVALAAGPTAVEFEHVGFAYPPAAEVSLASLEGSTNLGQGLEAQVLHDVSFSVSPGELVALVGRTGAGKTTISMLAARLYDVGAGAVRVNGVDVRQVTKASLQAKVGMVTQDPYLFHDSLRANLAYARPGSSDAELMDALGQAQIRSLVEGLPEGLDTVVGDRGYRFSGGEKQRVALARLILKQPDVVVLDEATAHLDSESEVAVQRALAATLAGRTSIVIAHRLSTVRRADQILVIDGGRIVERGKHADLLSQGGLYADLYRTQFADEAGDEVATGG